MMFEEYTIKDVMDEIIDYRGKTPKKLGSDWSCYPTKYIALSAKNIKKGRIVQPDTIRFVDEEMYNKWMKQEVSKGTILITSEAPFGELLYWDSDEKIVLSQRLFGLKIKKDFNPKYIYYYMYTLSFQGEMSGRATGSTVTGLRQPELLKCHLKIPNRKTQDKIADILSCIDKKIKLNDEINNNLFELGKTYFEEYLSNCNEVVLIRDIADEVLDYTKNKNDKVKLLNSSDITENVFPKVDFVDNKDLKGHFKKRFQKHDILYSQIRPRNHHYGYVLLDNSEDYLASTRFMVVRNKEDKVSSSLLYYYLTSKNAVDDFTTKTELRSGTFPQGNYEDLSSYVVKYSSNQESITKILDSILEAINNNNNENDNLSELRDTLLPKLMNGEIDLDNIEI